MYGLLRELHYGFRSLMQAPGSTAAAVLALALGIGANTAVFSVADVILFRPISLDDLDRLVMVWATEEGKPGDRHQVSAADFLEWRSEARTFEQLAAVSGWIANLTGAGSPQRVLGYRVSGNFFEALHGKASLGRALQAQDELATSDRTAVLSSGLWKRQFGSDPGVIGSLIHLHGQAHRVVGVMPADFRFPPNAEFWAPLVLTPQARQNRRDFSLRLVGRLNPGTQIQEAQAEMRTLAERLRANFPGTHAKRDVRIESLFDSMTRGGNRDFSLMLLAVVGFVLLIACMNVANLQIARVSGRARELGIRAALGAGPWRLIRQIVVENLVLAAFGGFLGMLLAFWGVILLKKSAPPDAAMYLPSWEHLGLNGMVLAYTTAAAVLAGLLSGILPALLGSRTNVSEVLKEGGRSVSTGLGRNRFRTVLVILQLVLAMTLLAGAGLMIKGFRVLLQPWENLQASNVLTFRLAVPDSRYPRTQMVSVLGRNLLDRISTLPGVESVGLVTQIPYSSFSSSFTRAFVIEGWIQAEDGAALIQTVSAGHFQTMRIPVREGRLFDSRDEWGMPGAAIVSASLAQRYFQGSSPLGRRLRIGDGKAEGQWLTVVGVVGDILHHWADRAPIPTLYVCFGQMAAAEFGVMMRTSDPHGTIAREIRSQVASVDPELPIFDVLSLDEVVERSISGLNLAASLMGIAGLVALILATVGVYSVTTNLVAERTHEIGVRLALGARPADIVWMVVKRTLAMAAAGLVLGLTMAYLLARILSSLIFGTSPEDLWGLAAAPLLLVFAAILASWLPVRNIGRIDPMHSLRHE
jgi:putative ABC transport system permease protein